MIFAKPNQIPVFMLGKLNLLLDLLRERKREFEHFASNIQNRSLRRTVLGLAQECNQYANELSGQIETMTGAATVNREQERLTGNSLLLKEEDMLQSCLISEKKMVAAYRSVLREPGFIDNLKSLLNNQLNGFACAFTQINLLNVSLYHG